MPVRLRTAIGLLLVLAVVAGACSRSGFSYVEQDEEGVYLKVPDDWAVFDTSPPPAEPTFGDLLGLTEPDNRWQVIIDSGPSPTASNFGAPNYGHPTGFIRVVPIQPENRDFVSTSSLRAFGAGFDPVSEPPEGVDVTVELNASIITDELRGSRIRFIIPAPDGSQILTDTITLTNQSNSRVYQVLMTCEVTCFRAHSDVIEDVINSFTVEN